MSTQPQTRQVKVEGTGKTRKGSRYLTTSAWFKSDYPVAVYLKEGQGEGIKDGDIITIVRGNLHEGKTGRYESDYYYDLVEAGQQPKQATQQPATASPLAKPIPAKAQTTEDAIAKKAAEMRDPTRTSIERQTSLNRATDIYVATINQGFIKYEDIDVLPVIGMAQVFEQYLATGEPPVTSQEAQDDQLPF